MPRFRSRSAGAWISERLEGAQLPPGRPVLGGRARARGARPSRRSPIAHASMQGRRGIASGGSRRARPRVAAHARGDRRRRGRRAPASSQACVPPSHGAEEVRVAHRDHRARTRSSGGQPVTGARWPVRPTRDTRPQHHGRTGMDFAGEVVGGRLPTNGLQCSASAGSRRGAAICSRIASTCGRRAAGMRTVRRARSRAFGRASSASSHSPRTQRASHRA